MLFLPLFATWGNSYHYMGILRHYVGICPPSVRYMLVPSAHQCYINMLDEGLIQIQGIQVPIGILRIYAQAVSSPVTTITFCVVTHCTYGQNINA